MKNYYDILEINKNASPEVVEKAYKTLVKKYHPDLQDVSSKKNAEDKMKELNEAYEVISNPEKRNLYNKKISQLETTHTNIFHTGSQTFANQVKTNDIYKHKSSNNNKDTYSQQEYDQEQLIKQAVNKAYYDAYIQNLKNRGYKIVYKKSLKDYSKMILRAVITLTVTLLFLFLIYHIPFVKNYFSRLYINNEVFRFFVDIFLQVFKNVKNNF